MIFESFENETHCSETVLTLIFCEVSTEWVKGTDIFYSSAKMLNEYDLDKPYNNVTSLA